MSKVLENKLDFLLDPEKNIFPSIINLEMFRGECPCKCSYCLIGNKDNKEREKAYGAIKSISIDLYRRVIEELSKYKIEWLRLQSTGEPLLSERLIDKLKISKENSIPTWLFTTAITKDKSLLEGLCRYTDVIEISVSSITPEDYIRAKGLDAFELVSKNIEFMRNYIVQNNLDAKIYLSRVETPDKQADQEFLDYWKSSGLADFVFIRDFIPTDEPRDKLSVNPCIVHWKGFNINIDGISVACYEQLYREKLNPDIILGDINTKSIKEIWDGQKLSDLREAEMTKDYSKISSDGNFPCKHCQACRSLYDCC